MSLCLCAKLVSNAILNVGQQAMCRLHWLQVEVSTVKPFYDATLCILQRLADAK